MNIVIFGGGTVGKLGHDFCLKARENNHNVLIFSHKRNETHDQKQYVIDYNDPMSCISTFDEVCSTLDKIDILFFNQVGGTYPAGENDLLREPNLREYNYTINSHVVIPHLFLQRFQDKLKDGSKVIFMTSNLGFQYDGTGFIGTLVGYAAGKSWATHLMHALSEIRKNKTTYVSLSPSVNYEDPESYKRYKDKLFDSIYNFIFSFDDTYNGKIISAWEANRHEVLKINVQTNP